MLRYPPSRIELTSLDVVGLNHRISKSLTVAVEHDLMPADAATRAQATTVQLDRQRQPWDKAEQQYLRHVSRYTAVDGLRLAGSSQSGDQCASQPKSDGKGSTSTAQNEIQPVGKGGRPQLDPAAPVFVPRTKLANTRVSQSSNDLPSSANLPAAWHSMPNLLSHQSLSRPRASRTELDATEQFLHRRNSPLDELTKRFSRMRSVGRS